MIVIPRAHKIFFGVICAAALLVAVLGYFMPAGLAAMVSWLVLPPLHARFVGALYFYGAVFMASCMMARYQAEVRFALPMIALWTGLLFVISILSLSAFDFARLPVWIWFASYLVYPLIALVLAWRQRRPVADDLPGPPLASWARNFLLAQGVVVSVFALALLLAPNLMVAVWPWKITPLLAQTYGGPLLAYGGGSWQFAQRRTWGGVRAVVPAMFVFTAGVLLASLIHRDLFSIGDVADWVWFMAFSAATVLLGLMTRRVLQPGRSM
ncbi:MAG: conserved rane protein of unknown function [Anaerolineales bacterium]|jgi:hypothetical protein|nr:conserved rane protein of unknown function [Anaerolineales bacterium]